jgi:LacI family transcriptional regulator
MSLRKQKRKRSFTPNGIVPRVAIILFAGVIGQEILRGIARYVRSHRPWQVLLDLGQAIEPSQQMKGWTGEGIIARIRGVPLRNWIVDQDVPCVINGFPDITGSRKLQFPKFDLDHEARVAADHFYSRGIRHFAFCPHASGQEWGRQQPFVKAIEALGSKCHIFVPSSPSLPSRPWKEQFNALCRWVRGLPKPIGIFTANDERGYQVIDACGCSGFRVPEDVAVLGDDNDRFVCELCNPPLSSIQRAQEELGYRCAELLDHLMEGKPIPPQKPLPPVRLIARQSTDVLAANDPEVAATIRFMRENLGAPFNVKDILREIPIGRRALEQRFSRIVGRTPGQEIRRMRIALATELLIDTKLSMPEIARRCGFASATRFTEAFRRQLGLTPSSFRHHRR